jgi:hypothetical protein
MFLSQWQYATYLLQRAGMAVCHSSSTPIDTQVKLSDTDGKLVYATEYMSLAGALQYLALTHLDISYAVQQICLHMTTSSCSRESCPTLCPGNPRVWSSPSGFLLVCSESLLQC